MPGGVAGMAGDGAFEEWDGAVDVAGGRGFEGGGGERGWVVVGNGYRPSGCGTRVRAVIPTVAAISRTRSPDNPNWRPIAENGVAVVRTARMIASSRTARPPPPG